MVKIIWTKRALSDLEEIGNYISKDSFHYAQITLEKIVGATSFLEANPFIGRKVPEINETSIRELIVGSYRLIYAINHTSIFILTIYHSARLLKKGSIKRPKK